MATVTGRLKIAFWSTPSRRLQGDRGDGNLWHLPEILSSVFYIMRSANLTPDREGYIIWGGGKLFFWGVALFGGGVPSPPVEGGD